MDTFKELAPYIPVVVGPLLGLLWAVAQLTPSEKDDKIIAFFRKLWSLVPVGETDPSKMGKKK